MAINNAYNFMVLFDVENGNPNGDPDAGNSPRIDQETQHGFITDVCLKRKIRNYVELVMEDQPGYNILVKPDRSLEEKFTEAYKEKELKPGKKGENPADERVARDYMCENYYDVRTFGAVMSTGKCSCGIVRGPVQINFARSLSPVVVQEVTITRQARANEDRQKTGETEIGRKFVIPYGLYRAEGYVSAPLAQKTGMSEEDLDLLWNAIINMFEHDHSAARGKMCVRRLFLFKHDNPLGNYPSHLLFDKIAVTQNNPEIPPRAFSDYTVTVDENMPEGVALIEKL